MTAWPHPDPHSPALFTDLYELTMAQAYWQSNVTAPATFSLFFRAYPPDRAYYVSAGLADVLNYLNTLHFSPADLAYLRSLNLFDARFLEFLQSLRFTGSVRAMREGAIFFADEPILEVTAPVIEAQLVETFLLNQIGVQTLLATKASRVFHAARGRTLIDFAARRTHGLDAAIKFARATYLVGFDGTSNVQAGAIYGIPVSGTMAHSFITAFPREIDAFRAFAASFPDRCTLLVDTYDTLAGTRNALIVARELRQKGSQLRGVRLDSGDLLTLSHQVRKLLDNAGFQDMKIFASGGLDEFEIDRLLSAGAAIDGFGIGTETGVSADAPAIDSAYKMADYAGRPVLKLSPNKQTLPGPKQVFRYHTAAGQIARDTIACANETLPEARPLLTPVMSAGQLPALAPQPTLQQLRDYFQDEFSRLPDYCKSLKNPRPPEVSLSPSLSALQHTLHRDALQRLSSPST